ncbi:Lysophosphatidic acid:oleoyl-CoA acyltransferase 1 [Umbelopsis nana]
MLVGPILALVRIVAATVVLALYFLFIHGFGGLLSTAPPLQKVWNKVWIRVLARITLFLIGFYYIRSEVVSVRRGRGHTAGNQKPAATNVGSGDIIVVNSSSYIDIIYLAFRFSPVFTQIDTTKNEVRFISAQDAIKQCGNYPQTSVNGKTCSLKDASRLAKEQGLGPIVVFPEGTTSNGRALLKFIPLFKEFTLPEKQVRFHVLALKYEFNYFSPTYTVGSKLVHFLKLCCQLSSTLTVKWLAPNESPSSSTFSVANITSASSTAAPTGAVPNAATDALANDGDIVGANLLTLLGGIARLRKTSLGINDKREFLDYYLQRTGAVKSSNTKAKKSK